MSINVVKVRPCVIDGNVVFNPNSIVEPSSCSPLVWKQDISAILIRGNQEEILRILENLKKNPECAIQIPKEHFSLFSWYEDDIYAPRGRSFNLSLYMGFGYLVTTKENGSGFYIGSRGIAENIVKHAAEKIKGYMLGQVSDVVDAVYTIYEKLKSEVPADKQEGELVFVISHDINNLLFKGEAFTYLSGEVKEDEIPNGIKFIDDGNGGLKAVNITFRNLLANCVA
ncbi:MAG: hypothetical protein ACRC53_11700 [Plesiomonas sp.]|uniref:hypothetical protein n=1 Tax=Plesiomonas sp. TaxID=2486279 RepID=UPI003F3886E0